jgi:hypothetical protein
MVFFFMGGASEFDLEINRRVLSDIMKVLAFKRA